MGENEDRSPEQPPNWDPEQVRRFEEFQRFQEFQRFTQAQPGEPGTQPPAWNPTPPPVPYHPPHQPPPGQPPHQHPGQQPMSHDVVPVPPGVPNTPLPDVHAQLTGMQQQLAELTAAQAKAIRAANRPLWQRILANKWTHRAIALVVVVVLAVWGVPALAEHYFGGNNEQNAGGPGAALPLPRNQSREYPSQPDDTVSDVFLFIAGNHAQQACFLFTDPAAKQFATAVGASDCPGAVAKIRQQVTDADAYSQPTLNAQRDIVSPLTVASCDFTIRGGPVLGIFTVTQQPDQTWAITGYRNGPASCAAATPTSTAPLTGGGIPTG